MRLLARNKFVCHSLANSPAPDGAEIFWVWWAGRKSGPGCGQFKPARIAFALHSRYAAIASCPHQPAFRWLAAVFV